MNIIKIKQATTFDDFIDIGYVGKKNNPLTPLVIAFNKLSVYYRNLSKKSINDFNSSKDSKIHIPKGITIRTYESIEHIYSGDYKDLFTNAIMAIYLCICNTTILIKYKKEKPFELSMEIIPAWILLHIGSTPTHMGTPILFYRLSGKETGDVLLAYIEDRYVIYNESLVELKYENFALDTRVVNTYLSIVIRSILDDLEDYAYISYVKITDIKGACE